MPYLPEAEKDPNTNGTLDNIIAESVYWQGEIFGEILGAGR